MNKKAEKLLSELLDVLVELVHELDGAPKKKKGTKIYMKGRAITRKEAAEIWASDTSAKQLSKIYKTCPSNISNIRNGWSWNSVTGLPKRKP